MSNRHARRAFAKARSSILRKDPATKLRDAAMAKVNIAGTEADRITKMVELSGRAYQKQLALNEEIVAHGGEVSFEDADLLVGITESHRAVREAEVQALLDVYDAFAALDSEEPTVLTRPTLVDPTGAPVH